jgi:hypothetical protein
LLNASSIVVPQSLHKRALNLEKKTKTAYVGSKVICKNT